MAIVTRLGNVHWLLAGALLGFGLMAAFSIGLPFFLLGMVLALHRVWRGGGRGFWLVLVGMGALPVVYLSVRYFTDDRATVFYDTSGYFKAAMVYGALALAGVVWGVIEAEEGARRRSRHE